LRVAVEQGWGGPSSREKRRWLASEIVDAFDDGNGDEEEEEEDEPPSADAVMDAHGKKKKRRKGSTPDAEDVGLMLAQALEDEFDASFEDGSVEAVAADIVALWGAGEDVVREWERKADGVRGKKVDVQEVVDDEDEWEDDSGEDEDEDEDANGAPQLMPADAVQVQRPAKPKPVIDDDGFTLVQKGRR
jgi:pre-rRNA-processing protein TSR2